MNSVGDELVHLSELAINAQFRLENFDVLVSTNDEAMARAQAGDPGNLWIVAGEQSGGRGRRGRAWASPPGNLYASLLLIDPAPVAITAQLGFVAGVALASCVRDVLGGVASFEIKWPNDLVHNGSKFSGLLIEATQTLDGRFACVIGFGVNCKWHPENLPRLASDLSRLAARSVTPAECFSALSANMVSALRRWRATNGFDLIRNDWLGFAPKSGRPIRVALASRHIEGLFRTIDSEGRLLLETAGEVVAIDAGEVFLPSYASSCSPTWHEDAVGRIRTDE